MRARCRVRPWQASVLACVVLAGTREGLVSPKSSSVIRGLFLVEILHSIEGGDVEQGCSNLETNLPCLQLLSLSLTCVYILHAYIAYIFICLIYLVLKLIYAWDCLFILVFNQASHSGTSTLIYRNLEEIVQSPSPGIRLYS